MEISTQSVSCPICEQCFFNLAALREHIKQPCFPAVTAGKFSVISDSASVTSNSGTFSNQGSVMSELARRTQSVSNNISSLGTFNPADIPILINNSYTPRPRVVSSQNTANMAATGNDISLLLDELSQRIPDSVISSVCNEVALRKNNLVDPDTLVKARAAAAVAPEDSTAVKVQLLNNSVTENFTWSDIANAALDMELLQGEHTTTSADVTSAIGGANLPTDCSYIIVDGDNVENTIMLVSDEAAATEALKADHVKLDSGLPTQDEIEAVTALLLAKSRVPYSSATASNIVVDSQGMYLNSSSEFTLNPNSTIIQPVLSSQPKTLSLAGIKQLHGKPFQTTASVASGIRQSPEYVNQHPYTCNIAKSLDSVIGQNYVKVKTVLRDPLNMSLKQRSIDKSPVSFQASYMDFVEESRSRRVNTDESVHRLRLSEWNNRNIKTYQSEVNTATASISGHTASGNKATRMRLSGPNLVKITDDANIVKTTIGDCVYVPSGMCDTLTGKSVVVVYPPISKVDNSHQNKMVHQTKVSSLHSTGYVSLLNRPALNKQLQQPKQQMPGKYVFTNPGFKCTNIPLNSRINLPDLPSAFIQEVDTNANRADDLIVNSAAPSEIFESESTVAAAAIDQIVSHAIATPTGFDQIVSQSTVNETSNTSFVESEMSIEELLVEAGLATKETLPDGTVQISTTLPVEELTKILQQIPNLDVSITVSDDGLSKTSTQDNDLLLAEHAVKTNYSAGISMTTESVVASVPALHSFSAPSPSVRSVSNQVLQPALGGTSNMSRTVAHGLNKAVEPKIVSQSYTCIPDINPKPPLTRPLLSTKGQHSSLVRNQVASSYIRIPAASPRTQQPAVNEPMFSGQVNRQPIRPSKPTAPNIATLRQPVSQNIPTGTTNVKPQESSPRPQYIRSAINDRPRLTSALTQAVAMPLHTNKPTSEARAPVMMPSMFSRQSHNGYASKTLKEDSSKNDNTITESQTRVTRPRVSATPKRLLVENPILPSRPGKKVGEFCLAKPVTKIGFNFSIPTVKTTESSASSQIIDVFEPVDISSTTTERSPKKTPIIHVSTRSSNRNNSNHTSSKSHTNRAAKHSLIVSGSLFSPAKKLRNISANSLVKAEPLSEQSHKTCSTSQQLNVATRTSESIMAHSNNSNISATSSKSSTLNNRTIDAIPQSLPADDAPIADIRGRKNLERTLKLDSQQICSILSEAGQSLDSEVNGGVDAKDCQLIGENNGDMVYVKYTDDVDMMSDGNTAQTIQSEAGNLKETFKINDRIIVEEINPIENSMEENVNSARNVISKIDVNITDSHIDKVSGISSSHNSSADASLIQPDDVVVGNNNSMGAASTAEEPPSDSSVQVVSLGEEDDSSTDGKFILKPDGTLETLDGQPVILKDENGQVISLDFVANTG